MLYIIHRQVFPDTTDGRFQTSDRGDIAYVMLQLSTERRDFLQDFHTILFVR